MQADRKRKADEDLDESGMCIDPDGDDRGTKRDREEYEAGLMSGSIDPSITDPITGAKWDLTDRNQQKRILKKVEIEKPYMIFMAPLKDTISIWTAREMMKFAMEACEVQRRGGRFFTLCQDDRVWCWHETGAAVLSDKPGVDCCTVDLCTYGLKAHDAIGNGAT